MRHVAAALLLVLGACAYFDGDDAQAPGSGAECGGFAGLPCGDNEFCNFMDPECGIADGAGTCQARPAVCPEIYAPVQGSDGQVYSNACEAHAHGVDDCGPPPAR